mgnify:CR=1 FL=1
MVSWQQTMDSTIRAVLTRCEREVLSVCVESNRNLASTLRRKGVAQALRLRGNVLGLMGHIEDGLRQPQRALPLERRRAGVVAEQAVSCTCFPPNSASLRVLVW